MTSIPAAPPSPPSPAASAVADEIQRQLSDVRAEFDRKLEAVRERTVDDAATIIVFSGDLDKVLAGFVLATGAAAAGLETSMFFTFWGLSVLKKKGAKGKRKSLKEHMFAVMTPGSSEELGTSKMNFFGMGARMLRAMMREKQISSLEELMAAARELGVKMMACTMSMDAMGVTKEELVDGLEYGGVAAYMADASRSRVTLFI
jgi:peroxiredoxin family protein